MTHDPINHPEHYTSLGATCDCGLPIECIQITERMTFTLGNVVKYCWRADAKGGLEDLRKAAWYLEREISNREEMEAALCGPLGGDVADDGAETPEAKKAAQFDAEPKFNAFRAKLTDIQPLGSEDFDETISSFWGRTP